MKKILLSISGLLVIFFAIHTVSMASDHSPIGSWAFSVDQAPWEYSRGTIIFEQNEDEELTGKIHFHTGQQITIGKISLDGSEMTFDVNVDGYDVQSVVSVSVNELTGYVVTMDGNMSFVATKEVEAE